MKKQLKVLFLLLILLFCVGSCISTKKQTYFQGEIKNADTDSFSNPIKDYLLRQGDVLHIKIISIDPRLSAFFNIDHNTSSQQTQATPGILYIQGYVVNDSGYVELPLLGSIKARGLTLAQFRESVSEKVAALVSTSTVLVKFASMKVSVTGEVNSPGSVYYYNERFSIMEALASAGDLTLTGKRSNIQVIRQHLDGSFESGVLDLNDVNVVHSPYFYLQPNDIVYVAPTRSLAAKFNVTNLSVAFAGISALVLILSYINK